MASPLVRRPEPSAPPLRLLLAEGEALIAWDMAYIVKTRFQCSITTVRRCDVMRAVLETACDVAVLDDTLDDDALIGTGRAITGVGCGLVICATRSAGQARNLACLDCPVVFKPFSDLRFCDAIEAAVRALRIRN